MNLVTELFNSTVKKYPEKTAFIDTKRSVSFRQLYEEGAIVATRLINEGLFKKPVLLVMEKSVSLVSCFVGVAYSGNFYSPLDVKMPPDRVKKIVETLKPAIVITDKKHEVLAKSFVLDTKVLVFDELISQSKVDLNAVKKTSGNIIDTDILYVLFTSGSTGDPKGVIINHKAAVDFVEWITDKYKFDESTVFANQAQLYFDLSIQDVYAPLKCGATTVLIPNRMYSFPVRVWNLILENNVNTLVWIPSMLSMFANLDILRNVKHASLKTVLFCGEVMPTKQLNYWINAYPTTTFANLYGPTECTEACTYYTIDRTFKDDEVLPIGTPCENSDALIINEKGDNITTPGEVGELCIRGTCLSSGYYGNPQKTAEVFVQNPLNNSYPELVYKTGDLVCYNDRNELVYVCRKDYQIKIRGYRVELGEIEFAASSMEGIKYNCCLFDDKNEVIILVYTGSPDVNAVKDFLATKLQNYMIPGEVIKREQMLFNINGKVDRKALKALYIK